LHVFIHQFIPEFSKPYCVYISVKYTHQIIWSCTLFS